MPSFKDLTRQVFGRLTALRCVGRNKQGKAVWLCRCSCGNEVEVKSNHLVSGHTHSCGCIQQEKAAARRGDKSPTFKHGHTPRHSKYSPTWTSWQAAIKRCTNSKRNSFPHYGGATPPVQICKGLREFTGFLAVLGERPKGTTLGRFGDIGHYSCGQCDQCKQNGWELNCEWQSRKAQATEQKVKRQLAFLAVRN
jgi:hypothetical protein